MTLSRPWLLAWLVALLAAFAVNRLSAETRPLGTALMLGLMAVYLIVFAQQVWRVGPRPLAFAMTAACLFVLYATADQFALALGWW